MQKITPFLWFDGNAEEAVHSYTAIFPNSRIVNVSRYGEGGPMPRGTVMVVTFELEGQRFMALNGGPQYKFSPALSLMVHCETQAEIDRYWEKLCAGGGREVACGWLQDRFGLSWQIVPTVLGELMTDEDPKKSERVMTALWQMKKIEIEGLKRAYEAGA